MILFLTQDLITQSTAKAAVAQAGTTLKVKGNLTALLSSIGELNPIGVFVDLQTPGLEINDLIARLADLQTDVPVIVFAQHVKAELLSIARTGPFASVVTRGQFIKSLPKLVQQFVASETDENPSTH